MDDYMAGLAFSGPWSIHLASPELFFKQFLVQQKQFPGETFECMLRLDARAMH